jgi:CRP-like cAMP-binding protein
VVVLVTVGGRVSFGRNDRHTQDVLRSLGASEVALVEAMTMRHLELLPNRQVAAEGEVGIGLFVITDGWAFRYREAGQRGRQIVDFLLPGEIIGLQAALLGVLEHSVRSLTAIRLTSYDSRLVGAALERSPGLALRLMRYVSAESARADALMTAIGCCDAVQRLAYLMLSLYHRQNRKHAVDPGACPFPLRRQHLADALGLTGAHVNRTINRLKSDGIASIVGQRLAIHDLARLTELAGCAD